MSDEPKKKSWALIRWTLLTLSVLYPLSMGPASWVCQHATTGHPAYTALMSAYAPIDWARGQSAAIDSAAEWYIFLWMGDIQ
jgi:hypothetical protein